MSYILEALKKAQAERQIGNTPTIHAPTLAGVPAGQGARGKRTPVIVAMALMAVAIVGLAAMLLRQPRGAGQPPAAAAPVVATAVPAPAAPAPAAVAVLPPAAPAAATVAVAPQAAPVSPSRDISATAPTPIRAAESPQPATTRPARAEARRADMAPVAPPATQPAVQAQAAAPVEEPVQSLRDLPEPIQRAIPQIALGGYMYSKNPADRLLLIDKVLRREGEEVAPGLILEKLQPKQAIFAFRGYRYRIAL